MAVPSAGTFSVTDSEPSCIAVSDFASVLFVAAKSTFKIPSAAGIMLKAREVGIPDEFNFALPNFILVVYALPSIVLLLPSTVIVSPVEYTTVVALYFSVLLMSF